MDIDIERLKTDAAYWDEVDDTRGKATHYCTQGGGFCSPDYIRHCDIPRPTKPAAPEWPEIGEHCETTWGQKQNWFECVVLPHEFLALFKYGEWSIMKISDFSNHEFRPLCTPEQRQREELIDLISHHPIYKNSVNALADDILSRYNLEPKP